MPPRRSNIPVYITTTLPYVNADPHIGFALEIVHADIFARYQKLLGREVFFNTGTDEHGQKIFESAKKAGVETKQYVDEYAKEFLGLGRALGLSPDIHFLRTSSGAHKEAAEEFWRRCAEAGDIYKKQYQMKYCVGCELEKTDSELLGGKCPIHPNLTLELVDEENYFFRFSKYQKPLLDLYESRPDFVVPDFRFNEIKAFVSRGLQDFSISRLKSKMSWGVPVPSDSDHVMYVWFDALVSYISTLGWPASANPRFAEGFSEARAPAGTAHFEGDFDKWWVESGGVVQFAGKDQIRMQAAMWQAMLMSAGLTPSKQIVIHGFINTGGQKMSKSLGNVISPYDLVKEYGTDALRYYLARHIHPFEDSDVTIEKFKAAYNGELANGLGNLVSRVLKMAALYEISYKAAKSRRENPLISAYAPHLENYEVAKAAEVLSAKVKELDQFIQREAPFKKIKIDEAGARKDVERLLAELNLLGEALEPFMPETSAKILDFIQRGKPSETPLFLRKE
jgi:methionyl-tRNA synthetase